MADRRYALIGHVHEAPAAPAWGEITGTLADQTDLQAALDGKAASSHTHVAADVDAESSTDGFVLTSDGAGNAAWEVVAAGGDPGTIIGDINMATPPVPAAFTGELQIVDADETDVIGTFGYDGDANAPLYIKNFVRYSDTVFEIADFNGGGTPFEALRLHKGNSAAAGQEGYIMANRGIFNYLGTFTISNPDPPLMVTTGAGEDGQTSAFLGIWNNAIQRFTSAAAGFASLNINTLGGTVTIGATSGTGGVNIYHDGNPKILADTTATAVYFPNTSSTAPSGGTVGADNRVEITSRSQSPIARMGVRASDDVAYLGHDIHGQPWVIEAQNESGSNRQIMNLDPTSTSFGAYIGKTGSTNQGSLWIYEMAAALTAQAGYGQLWIKNTTPCELWFTDDAGTSTQIV